MRFDVISPAPASEWDRLYALDDRAMPTQSKVWAGTITKSTKAADRSRFYRFEDGAEAVLPLFAGKYRPWFFNVTRSPPAAWGFGGLISSQELAPAHVKAVLDDCAALQSAAIQIRPNPLYAQIWSDASASSKWQSLPRSAHILDISGGFDDVWTNRFPGKTRNRVRKAAKLGVTVETGLDDRLIDDFDGLFRRSLQRWAQRQNEFGWLAALRGRFRDSKQKFATMAHDADSIVRVSIARLNGAPVAGIVVLYGKNAHYTRGAMDERLIGNSYANYLLQSKAIEEACARSCDHYHMGETGSSDSLARFKSGFGAVAVPYAEYRFERFPVLSADQKLRSVVKKAIGFKDA